MWPLTAALILIAITIGTIDRTQAQKSEPERVADWYARNNTWPPRWHDERVTWRRAMKLREEELLFLPGVVERWRNFVPYTQSRLVKRFTERGYEVMKIPPEVFKKLKSALDEALQNWDNLRLESHVDMIYTPLPSKLIPLGPLADEVGQDLKPLHEAWSGLELKHTTTFYLRLYQDGASLAMHYDRVRTHVISSILNIGYEYADENEPWPIEIEDHDGVQHAFYLQPGEMLVYESASCLHGRRKVFKGKYYASLSVFYQPVSAEIWNYTIDDVLNSVPPFWREGTVEEVGNRLAGDALTTDSQITDAAPKRIINGEEVSNIKEWYAKNHPDHYLFVQNHMKLHDAYISEKDVVVPPERTVPQEL